MILTLKQDVAKSQIDAITKKIKAILRQSPLGCPCNLVTSLLYITAKPVHFHHPLFLIAHATTRRWILASS